MLWKLRYDPLLPGLKAEFMSQGASLGVLLPTRNSAALLARHLASLSTWLDLADEVVVVDSFSSDGTRELLQRGLRHPALQVLSHPPGLYASWNAGLRALSTDYAYIATVGDTITRAGVEELLRVAGALDADVVLSKPAFLTAAGARVERAWPIDDILRRLQIQSPRRLSRLESLIFAAAHPGGALTGSCASDLFRTSALQRHPFPTEFGTGGDGIWGLRQAGRLSWAVVPGSFSTFLLHETTRSQAENQAPTDAAKADVVLIAAVADWRREGLVSDADLAQIGWPIIQSALTDYLEAKTEFDRCRHARRPWIFCPGAWRARSRRNHGQARLHQAKTEALEALARFQSAEPRASFSGLERRSA
jgi:glycosyltransferase involved in cell wall biosynthesis